MDNVGIVVESLDAAVDFFRELGLELEGRAMVEGEWAGRVTGLDDQRVDSRYDLGEVVDRYQAREQLATIYWGRSAGLVGDWARRVSFGLTFEDHAFGAAPGEAAPLLQPGDRRLVYPWVAAEWVQDQFHTERNRDQIEKTEDISMGWRARAQMGFASTATGSDRDAFILGAGLSKGCISALIAAGEVSKSVVERKVASK